MPTPDRPWSFLLILIPSGILTSFGATLFLFARRFSTRTVRMLGLLMVLTGLVLDFQYLTTLPERGGAGIAALMIAVAFFRLMGHVADD